ncbi:UBX domain-containing protein 6 [Onthophagus taurus]|uniref:UBX domain-containing protein 6 n=1 Tax=Onthophagus taurus TaxID=166361 RepID=UPI000C206B78|nr:UBX domain-containing protein 6 [Onthophagus taurus]
MAEKIKKFFQKKKLDAKFKLAGPGHKLAESSSSIHGNQSNSKNSGTQKNQGYVPPPRAAPSSATRQAAEAALARLNSQRKDTPFNTSLAAIQAQVKRELEAEKKNLVEEQIPTSTRPIETNLESSPLLAVNGVYFRCPIINEEVLPKEEWRIKIKSFLFDQLEEERGLTACLIIHSCNYNRSKVNDCVGILCKYLENIIQNPTETKFQKIRCSNATYREKVEPILGATEFLYAAGFRLTELDNNGSTETYWVFSLANIGDDISSLEFLTDAIKAEDRIELELDRSLQVLSPAQANKRVELPDEFFAMNKEDIRKEQLLRTEAMQKQMQLRTKAMREKDELREIRKYKFALIRIRFPDGVFLQGTFSVYEKFSEVLSFIQENLEHDCPFIVLSPTGHKFEETDNDKSLVDLRLVPATILNFQWDPSIADEIQRVTNSYLKPELMMLIQAL